MAFLGQEEQIREYQERFRFLYTGLAIALLLLVSRLVYLQILKGDELRHYSEENRIKKVKVAAPRGMIFDRNRKLLIDNRPAFDLEIIPQYLKESKETDSVVALLSGLIQMPEKDIYMLLDRAKFQPTFLPIKIKTDLSRDEVAQIETWKIAMPGVQVQEEIKRTNIYGEVAAHLLGYIGEISAIELPSVNDKGKGKNVKYKLGDVIGKSGLEARMEDVLRGVDGEKLVEVDALGRIKLDRKRTGILSTGTEKPAVPGKNLVLTIDQDLQMAALEAFGEKAGALVAIDPNSGAILAMISRPSFDPTEFSRGISPALWQKLVSNENLPLRDKTLQDHYPPGSVFKVVTAIAGLQDNVIDENWTVNCSGKIHVGNRDYHCHKRGGHGNVNIVKAISQSCDVFFWRLAQKLKSVDDIARWARYLGLGQRTGINLAREVPGLIPTEEWKQKAFHEPWNAGETLHVAIGQGYVLTTVLQLANLYASIANGGTHYRPYLVEKIESFEGEVLEQFDRQIVQQHRLSPRTYELIKQGLWGVLNAPGGTAVSQRLPGMEFVGKTGTAQVMRIAADKIYQHCENLKYKQRHNGIFAGFAPASNPKIAVAVIAEHACSGSHGAAPIGRAVVKAYLQKYFPDLYSDKAIALRLAQTTHNGGFEAQPNFSKESEEGIVINESIDSDDAGEAADEVDARGGALPDTGGTQTR